MEILRKDLKKMLLQSGCAIALLAGVVGSANAQLAGSLGVGATGITNGGGFGMNANAWVPFMGFGAYLEGGFQDGNPYGDVGLGGRFMVGGNIGLGGLVSFAMQKGDGSDKMFYAIKPTFEVGFGGLTFSSTLQIPVGKKERNVKNSGSAQGELRNQPGNTNCSAPPMGTVSRVCNVWLVGREQSVEENSFGANLNVQYELNLGGFAVTPNVGVYVYDRQGKNLVGVQGGVKVGLALGNGLAIEGGIGFRHDNKNQNYDNNNRTQAIFSAGLTWHFGGNAASASTNFVDRPFSRSVFDRGIHTQEKLGNSFVERARLQDSNSNAPIDQVEFVDSTVMNPWNKIGNLGPNRMIIVQGGVNFGNNTSNIDSSNVFIIGGGSSVGLVGMNGHTGTFHTPGTRPTITADNVAAVFNINNRSSVIFKGFDITGTAFTTRHFRFENNAHYGMVDDVSVTNGNTHVAEITSSDNVRLNNVRGTNIGQAGVSNIAVNNSMSTSITNLTLRQLANNSFGVTFTNSPYSTISGFDIDDNDNNYDTAIRVLGTSDHVKIEHGSISNFDVHGIVIDGAGASFASVDDVTIKAHATATNGHGIFLMNGPDDVSLTNITATGRGAANFRALQVDNGSLRLSVGNFHAENWERGFGLTAANTTVIDLSGNTFNPGAAGLTACDNTNDIDAMSGSLNVTTTTTGVGTPCR